MIIRLRQSIARGREVIRDDCGDGGRGSVVGLFSVWAFGTTIQRHDISAHYTEDRMVVNLGTKGYVRGVWWGH